MLVKRSLLFLFLLLCTLVLDACSKKQIIRQYYVIELPQVTKVPETEQLNYNVDVRNFRVGQAFDQTRIAVRTDSHELNYYYYHHWAVKPSQAVADVVYEYLEQTNLFTRTFRGFSYSPDYLVTGEVKSLERVQKNNSWYARIDIRLELIDAENELSVVEDETDLSRALDGKSMNEFAIVSSQLVLQASQAFFDKVVEHMRQQNTP